MLAQTDSTRIGPIDQFASNFFGQIGEILPNLLWGIVLLVIGIVIAYIAALVVKNVLKRTQLDDRLAAWVTGRSPEEVPAASWFSSIVFWLIVLLAIVAFLDALELRVVSESLNGLLATVFEYIPNIVGAALLLALAWAIATVVKLAVTRGLARFNLDDRLAEQTGTDAQGQPPVQVHETLGNALYWFIFLLFLPLVLSALELPGLLAPIESLIDQFLDAIPQILTAAIVLLIGWLVAKIVRGIVTNLLASAGVDRLGTQMGLTRTGTGEGVSLSSLAGTIVYVLILIPVAIAALNELDIRAISDPAVEMLDRILVFIPLLITAGVVLVVFYFIGRFIADLVTSLLQSAGFDRVFDILGLPELSSPSRSTPPTGTPTTLGSPPPPPSGFEGQPSTVIQPPEPTATSKSPSEVVGLVVLVGIVLFGAVTATEILQLEGLRTIVEAILSISAQVIVGVVIFAIGLYAANLVYRLISSSGTGSSNTLAQAARIAIIAFVGAMALQQMGVATSIVNLAFGLLLGAVAVAIAISFGLGGREVANNQLKEWVNHLKR
ncbi:mechanosensitive ion channel [Romeria aff. gracilis LEGE 07310]|uniref:Mechanosensitive ion channel n=1 Tax=Vasconcelosia minhoensis LEGE 07310 TaxID=915328 RepID=A0A8J7A7X0_9CYAN|nr:mechanosensitive ion channel [Romeria gracilis]MBE9078692.1 mechanosensitive ion channel [Romeria aff. gracilis LEGE 07310]